MATTIFVIRHGEVFNPDDIIYGRLPNFGLSDLGKKQIEQTAGFLSNKNIDQIYTSPLQRTRQTSEIIQKILGLSTLHFSEKILEVKTSYEGNKFSTLDVLQSEVYLKPLSPEDETLVQISRRMEEFIGELIKQYTNKSIVTVSHGDPIMVLRATIDNLPLTLSSIGKGGKIKYIQHGEIYEITSDGDNKTIKEVFKPSI